MPDNIHLTVAALVCRNEKFLLVREYDNGLTVINQPAGHVEVGESPVAAVKRETLEETGWLVEPSALLGFSVFTSHDNGITYYRFSFICKAIEQLANAEIDADIVDVLWLSRQELLTADPLRSPMVLQTIKDYQAGISYPLEFIRDYR
ncbi:MAG: NUDIX hydrolase [Gammaproteobacteria bacterium]|nr:MAG: NUDIX hydrolase [Gammaproteobacteria bacterium]